MSMTSKAHPDQVTSGANLTYTNENITQDDFYAAAGAFHEVLPSITDAGATAVWTFTNTTFSIMAVTAPGLTKTQLAALLQPYLTTLTKMGIQYDGVTEQFPGYLDQFNTMFPFIDVGVAQYGGRWIPRSVAQANSTALMSALRNITEDGATFIGVGLNVSQAVVGDAYNAVNPGWRDCLIDTVLST